jgi:hypothetical protein
MIEPFRFLVDYSVWKLTEAHTRGIDKTDYARTREVNLNADQKRFWIESLNNVKDKVKNLSYPLNPQRFPKEFELNDDYEL